MKKIALIGRGKTGGEILKLLDGNQVQAFDSKTPWTHETLNQFSAAIVFVTPDVFPKIQHELAKANIPIIVGTTGIKFSEQFAQNLIEQKKRWVIAANFSLGMNIVKEMIQVMANINQILAEGEFKIHEIHHIHKKDSPSGTAIKWQEWLGQTSQISSERLGDEIGTHQLTWQSAFEKITLEHQSLNRGLFAQGALWASQQVITDVTLPYGLIKFEDLVASRIHKREGYSWKCKT